MNQHVKDQKPKPQLVKPAVNAETRTLEAFLGPDGQIYLPEGTVLAEGEELVLESGQDESKPIYIKVLIQ